MRGRDTKQASMLCLVSPESVVPADHPLRAIKRMVEIVLRDLSPVFDEMYAKTGRPSVPGCSLSISLRRMIERIFGWMKATANFRRTRLRGLARTTMLGTFVGAAYNILRPRDSPAPLCDHAAAPSILGLILTAPIFSP